MNSANRLSIICLELPNIKHRVKELLAQEKALSDTTEIMTLIGKAINIDKNLEDWTRTLPEAWNIETRKVVNYQPDDITIAEFWPGPVYIYQDLKVANLLNDCRICRIFCQSIVLGCIAALPMNSGEWDHISTQALYIIQQAVNEICWSIPYLLGFDYHNRPNSRPEDEKGRYKAISQSMFAVTKLDVRFGSDRRILRDLATFCRQKNPMYS